MTRHGDHDLIIERPDLQSWPLVLGSRLITAALWVLYVYLWLPLLTLIGWVLGIKVAYDEMIASGGIDLVFSMWFFFASVIALIGAVLLGWARINLYRFRDMERRRAADRTDTDRMAFEFRLAPDALLALQACRRAVLAHAPDGELRDITLGLTRPGPARRPDGDAISPLGQTSRKADAAETDEK